MLGPIGYDGHSISNKQITTTIMLYFAADCHDNNASVCGGIRYRNHTHYTLYRSFLPIYGITIVRSLSFLFLDDFEGNTNISVFPDLIAAV